MDDRKNKKVLIVATVVQTHIAAFHLPTMKMLKENGWRVEVASHNDYENPEDMNLPDCDAFYEIPFARNPFSFSNIKAYKMLKKIIDEGHYDVVHCHTPVGGVLTRLAARKARKNGTKVFYTAHGFHFFNGAPLINWVYYPIEKTLSKVTDTLFTINSEDYERAKKHFFAKNVVALPGIGIDYDRFAYCQINKTSKRIELGIPENAFLILSVGELTKRKNHQVIIKAMKLLNDSSIHYVICGRGKENDSLHELVYQMGLCESVHFLGFRSDVPEICKAADVFAFPSTREGLGLAAIEAMASGLPIIGSNVNGIKEYSINGQTGWYSTPFDVQFFADSIIKIKQLRCPIDFAKTNTEIARNYSIAAAIAVLQQSYLNDEV